MKNPFRELLPLCTVIDRSAFVSLFLHYLNPDEIEKRCRKSCIINNILYYTDPSFETDTEFYITDLNTHTTISWYKNLGRAASCSKKRMTGEKLDLFFRAIAKNKPYTAFSYTQKKESNLSITAVTEMLTEACIHVRRSRTVLEKLCECDINGRVSTGKSLIYYVTNTDTKPIYWIQDKCSGLALGWKNNNLGMIDEVFCSRKVDDNVLFEFQGRLERDLRDYFKTCDDLMILEMERPAPHQKTAIKEVYLSHDHDTIYKMYDG